MERATRYRLGKYKSQASDVSPYLPPTNVDNEYNSIGNIRTDQLGDITIPEIELICRECITR